MGTNENKMAILVIDDDKSMLSALTGPLERRGYIIRSFKKTDEALQEIDRSGIKFDYILIDYVLEDGAIDPKVIPKLADKSPDSKIILYSGKTEIPTKSVLKSGVIRCIHKYIERENVGEFVDHLMFYIDSLNDMDEQLSQRQEGVKWLHKTLDNLDTGICIIDRVYGIWYRNKKHIEMFGGDPKPSGSCWAAFLQEYARMTPCKDCPAKITFKEGKDEQKVLILRTAYGLRFVRVTSMPVRNDDDEVIGAILSTIDINEIANLKGMLSKLEELSEKSLGERIDTIINAIRDLGYNHARIYLASPNGKEIVLKKSIGHEPEPCGIRITIEGNPYWEKAKLKESPTIFNRDDIRRYKKDGKHTGWVTLQKDEIEQWIVSPMIVKNETIGCICVDNGPALFQADDFKWHSFLRKLREPEKNVEELIFKNMDEEIKPKLPGIKPLQDIDDGIKVSVISTLNRIIEKRDFFDKEVLEDINYPEHCNQLWRSEEIVLTQGDIRRLNRLIIESIYPHNIVRKISKKFSVKDSQCLKDYVKVAAYNLKAAQKYEQMTKEAEAFNKLRELDLALLHGGVESKLQHLFKLIMDVTQADAGHIRLVVGDEAIKVAGEGKYYKLTPGVLNIGNDPEWGSIKVVKSCEEIVIQDEAHSQRFQNFKKSIKDPKILMELEKIKSFASFPIFVRFLLLNEDDILDWHSFLDCLKRRETIGMRRTWDFLENESKSIISNWNIGIDTDIEGKLKKIITRSLNRIIEDKTFFLPESFVDDTISEDALILYKKGIKNLGRGEIQKINRLVLNSLFTKSIKKIYFEIFGVLSLKSLKYDFFESKLCNLIRDFCYRAAVAIRNERLQKQEREMARKLRIMNRIGPMLQTEPNYLKNLFLILTGLTMKGCLEFNRAILFLTDEGSKEVRGELAIGSIEKKEADEVFRNKLWEGEDPFSTFKVVVQEFEYREDEFKNSNISRAVKSLSFPVEDRNILLDVMLNQTAKRFHSSEVGESDSFFRGMRQLKIDTSEFAIAPLLVRGNAIGALYVDNKYIPRPITSADTGALQLFANQAAAAIDSWKLLQEKIEMTKFAALGQFTASSSHRIMNPLSAIDVHISNFNEAKELGVIDLNKTSKIIDKIDIQIGRIRKIIKEFKEFSGRPDFKFSIVNPTKLVKEHISTFGSLAEKNLIYFNLEENVGYIQADENKLIDIMEEIISNASTLMEQVVEIRIGVNNATREENWKYNLPIRERFVKIQISDTGHGIPCEDKNKIFEPFYTTRNKDDSIGLGLSLIKLFVEYMDGHIFEDGIPGEGANFLIFFPEISKSSRT
ncbi:MAG: response regulator [Candidatus Eremiobacteraeota bacterium]|nr:response regulator [Candidatus Eremiobacteraeota bacterium]